MNLFYSGFVLFTLAVICSSIPVPRKQTDVKDSSQKTPRTEHVYYTSIGRTHSGVQAQYMGSVSGECHYIFACTGCIKRR